MGQIWPIFMVLGGLATLWSYYKDGRLDAGRVFSGVAAFGLGLYFFLFTLELTLPVLGHFEWSRMGEFWPGFILIGGLAFLAQFAATGFRQVGLLLTGLLVSGVGLVAFAFTLQFLSQTLARQVAVFWPVALILLGLWLATQAFLKRS
jgi:hypothetical protein